jgi:hypothetical protein
MGIVNGPADRWRGSPLQAFQMGQNPPNGGDMEARVAKLEAGMEYVQRDLAEIKLDVRAMRDSVNSIRTTDFRLIFGAIIAVAIGLAGLMGKGFGWF